MKIFWISQEDMVREYLDKIDVSIELVVMEQLKILYPKKTMLAIHKLYVKRESKIDEAAQEAMKWAIREKVVQEKEVDESSGNWSYYKFRLKNSDLKNAKVEAEEEIIVSMKRYFK